MIRWVIESRDKYKDNEHITYFKRRGSFFNEFDFDIKNAKKYTSPQMAKLEINKYRLTNCRVIKKRSEII